MAKSAWALYDRMIEGIPEDLKVIDYCLGVHWSCVVADCGGGVSYTCRGGAKYRPYDMRGASLREAAALSKSWSFEEATLGIAALNAYYAHPDRALMRNAAFESDDSGESSRIGRKDAFAVFRPRIEEAGRDAKVVVVGHFPNVAQIAGYADLTVLERNCQDAFDTPDPACEYVLPHADFLFTTGVTLINKTAPRLLQLAESACSVMVGPSAVPCQALFDCGLDNISGRVVVDAQEALFSCRTGNRFGSSLRMFTLDAPAQR
ncbi:Rossmann-like domain-containing protein [Gordonibacter sp. Marseille-P4307]|uniref:Rossmann-like domain-containing protein n=1 Tax=Gordonibacter sp. Marseille-P4307 TaxID=2161815 RepID=UPI000F528E51|nr:DUF364 domain-containing protein [Gordonibacter sp. Marseille-P4307]